MAALLSNVFQMFRLDGQVAVVTGSHSWLGFDMACALAEAGANIVITSRDLNRAEITAKRLQALYPQIESCGVQLDQRSSESCAKMVEQAFSWKGRFDVLINNAGGGVGDSEGDLFKRLPEDSENLLQINLLGVLHCCREAARVMKQQGQGVMINIASIAGIVGRDRRMYEESDMKSQPVDYAAAKAGVIGLTRDLAASLGRFGIRVNSISPGGFDKGILPQRFTEGYAGKTMLGRWGQMGRDLKGAALYLASEASAYVTGHNLVVDGGFSVYK
ncbi:SDR family oxidoreductase [Marispirochaeta sp.]|uniref:SDR family NAD(P)-dependent oxidoreductase n=1 Tax=Marispirochaeta sp. TaxID=2038653 RepID=UPI0029C93412|nr:SDR family oxidoreductase [Marispirochaeta sp.]